MKPIGTPVMRLTPQSIVRSFRSSNKKHLLLTGSRGSGKSTLASAVAKLLGQSGEGEPLPGIITYVIPEKRVILRETATGRQAVIGRYERPRDGDDSAGGCMKPVLEGLETLGCEALLRCRCGGGMPDGEAPPHCRCGGGMSDGGAEHCRCGGGMSDGGAEYCRGGEERPGSCGEWVLMDELGYLESGCPSFCGAVEALFEEKRVLAVVRKCSTAFLDRLRSREDVFCYDLDAPVPPVGCIIMASGRGCRFGGNKLLAQWEGEPLIARALGQTEGMFASRVVVTCHPEIAGLCRERGISCILHDLPGRNDTVRLGVDALRGKQAAENPEYGGPLAGYVFCPADQPLLTRETLETLLLEFGRNGGSSEIFRLSGGGRPGAPVLFGADYAEELRRLPQGKGGSWLLRKYPKQVHLVEAEEQELWDVDTPEDLEKCRRRING